MKLVTVLSTGKGSWTQVYKLISSESWDKIFIVTNEFGKSHFNKDNNVDFIITDFNKNIVSLSNDIFNGLKSKINDLSVGLNLYSGDGKTHMAVLYSLIRLGVGIELVYFEDDKIKLLKYENESFE